VAVDEATGAQKVERFGSRTELALLQFATVEGLHSCRNPVKV
jgi:hypothetical protein